MFGLPSEELQCRIFHRGSDAQLPALLGWKGGDIFLLACAAMESEDSVAAIVFQ